MHCCADGYNGGYSSNNNNNNNNSVFVPSLHLCVDNIQTADWQCVHTMRQD